MLIFHIWTMFWTPPSGTGSGSTLARKFRYTVKAMIEEKVKNVDLKFRSAPDQPTGALGFLATICFRMNFKIE